MEAAVMRLFRSGLNRTGIAGGQFS